MVEVSESGAITITGDSIELYRLIATRRALELYLRTGMKMNRMATPKVLTGIISEYTGKTYARSRKGYEAAAKDVAAFLESLVPK